ncbi:unnamed protein product [Adineta steineri]|uniref:Uncharacterized protein n=1 Tax=Adineta steineri TaxID=433720 RepID=A0A815TCN9_9BILA|nr:unnamed protein product [Adineta steineri]CAF4070463.1 unnamed protein product [Adineta steineri]
MSDANENEKEINRFHDIHHAYNYDDLDEDDDDNIDFDDLYTDFYQNENKNEIPVEPINDNESNSIDVAAVEEQRLSQKLSQLSASNQNKQLNEHKEQEEEEEQNDLNQSSSTVSKKRSSSTSTTIKKMKLTLVDVSDNDMPRYLSKTKGTFDTQINNLLYSKAASNSHIDIEQLRQIAVLLHKIGLHQLYISLWETYLRSGTGTLKDSVEQTEQSSSSSSLNLLLWPQEVKTSMIEHRYTTLEINQIDHDTCLNYVQYKIQQFHDLNTHCEMQLEERKRQLTDKFTEEIEEIIKKFVEDYGISIHRIPIDGEIATIEYNYNDRLFELDFHRENPHPYQMEVFQKLSQEKLNKETTRMEVNILKQRIVHKHLPSSFESLKIPVPIKLDNIRDEHIRQRLTQQCTQLFERTKSDMMMIYIQTAEAKFDEYRKKFDTNMANYEDNQRSGVTHRKLSQSMLKILNERFKSINQYVTKLYRLKIDFFVKAPMVKN